MRACCILVKSGTNRAVGWVVSTPLMVWRGVGTRLADDTPDPAVTAFAWPETGLVDPVDGVSDCGCINIRKQYTNILF